MDLIKGVAFAIIAGWMPWVVLSFILSVFLDIKFEYAFIYVGLIMIIGLMWNHQK